MFEIRFANPSEADELSELASRSKSYWPYGNDYLDLCRAATHVTDRDVKDWPFIVSIQDGKICGFAAVSLVQGVQMLDHMWIEPGYIGKGLGRLLFERAVEEAKKLSWTEFEIASDPYAEKFYLKLGAYRIGEKESKIKPGFFLPLLRYEFK